MYYYNRFYPMLYNYNGVYNYPEFYQQQNCPDYYPGPGDLCSSGQPCCCQYRRIAGDEGYKRCVDGRSPCPEPRFGFRIESRVPVFNCETDCNDDYYEKPSYEQSSYPYHPSFLPRPGECRYHGRGTCRGLDCIEWDGRQ
ncbi:hypothetical protein COJ45_27830 [Bacillus cereus]|nr:hypothetical protein COJ45_27830 [Bacillus cereus]